MLFSNLGVWFWLQVSLSWLQLLLGKPLFHSFVSHQDPVMPSPPPLASSGLSMKTASHYSYCLGVSTLLVVSLRPPKTFGILLSYMTWFFSCWELDRYKYKVTCLMTHCEFVTDLVNLQEGVLNFFWCSMWHPCLFALTQEGFGGKTLRLEQPWRHILMLTALG